MNATTHPIPAFKRHLLTLYTRSPLHVGSGASVDVVDLPIVRERITGFPVIPNSSLKGVLRQWGRDARKSDGSTVISEEELRFLFGEDRPPKSEEEARRENAQPIVAHAGCVQIMEAKLLAFPLRSLAGCFAWLTCPTALRRFQRDTGKLVDGDSGTTVPLEIPEPEKDKVYAGSDLRVPDQNIVVFEEYALERMSAGESAFARLAAKLGTLCADSLWAKSIAARFAIVHDENFQHFVTTCTEVVTRIAIDPITRTVKGAGGGGALFDQENVPCETLFYTVLTVLPPRIKEQEQRDRFDGNGKLAELLPVENPPILQIGGDETTGHGLCETKREVLP